MESKENDKSCDEEMGSAGGAGNPEEGKETGPAQEGNPVSQSAGDGNPGLQTGPVPGQTPFPYGYFQSPNLHPGYYMAQGGFPRGKCLAIGCRPVTEFPHLTYTCSQDQPHRKEQVRRADRSIPAIQAASNHRANPKA